MGKAVQENPLPPLPVAHLCHPLNMLHYNSRAFPLLHSCKTLNASRLAAILTCKALNASPPQPDYLATHLKIDSAYVQHNRIFRTECEHAQRPRK